MLYIEDGVETTCGSTYPFSEKAEYARRKDPNNVSRLEPHLPVADWKLVEANQADVAFRLAADTSYMPADKMDDVAISQKSRHAS